MTIAFVCPNGHQLNAPKALAGKPGKCPKCGTKFLVPTLEEMAEAGEGQETGDSSAQIPISDSRSVKPGSSIDTPAPGSGKATARFKEVFVFLCPNGHRLNGPPTLKGKPGQCPHCGTKFLIPMDDAEAPAADAADEVPTGEVVEEEMETPVSEPMDEEVETTPEPEVEEEAPVVEVVPAWHLPPPEVAGGHRLAELFTWFWAQREPKCIIELVMKDGQTYSPKLFAPELSQQNFGVFAMHDETGKFTMTTLCWDNVSKVIVRNLDEIPHALFE